MRQPRVERLAFPVTEHLADDTFDRLIAVLDARSADVAPAWLHGLLTASATAPVCDLTPLGEAVSPDRAPAAELVGLLKPVADDVAQALESFGFGARMAHGDPADGERWLRGYLHGIDLYTAEWGALLDGSDVARDAVALCRTLLGDAGAGPALPRHVDAQALLGSTGFLSDMAARMYGAVRDGRGYDRAGVASRGETIGLPSYDEETLRAMSVDDLAACLLDDGDRVPRDLVDECIRRGDAMVSVLRAMIDYWDEDDESDAWWCVLHAVKILGGIPGAAAADALLQGFLVVHERAEDMADWLGTDWPLLFLDKDGQHVEAMRALVEDRTVGWYLRASAAECVVADAFERTPAMLESTLDWVAALTRDESDDVAFRLLAAMNLLELPRERHREGLAALAAAQAELPPAERLFLPREVDETFAQGDRPGWREAPDPLGFYDLESIVERQARWSQDVDDDVFVDEARGESGAHVAPGLPYARTHPKVGRNDPCPCGSGRKYKKCCGANS